MDTKRIEDEFLVMDFLLGRLDAQQQEQLKARMAKEDDLKRLCGDVSNALGALGLLSEVEDCDGLVEKTLARIRQDQQMKAILARQEMKRRRVFMPTFSLRELGVVAAAAVLMAVVFIPSIRAAHRRALQADCTAQAGQIGSAILSYANNNNGQLPAAGSQEHRWLPSERSASASNSSALFRLVQMGYAKAPAFQCPAIGGESFPVQAGMVDFPAGQFVSYSYQHTLGRPLDLNDSRYGGKQEKMAIMADATPVFSDGQFHPDRANDQACSDNHNGAGQNVLYLPGNVKWVDSPTVGIDADNIYLVRGVVQYRGDETPSDPTDTFLLPAYSGQR